MINLIEEFNNPLGQWINYDLDLAPSTAIYEQQKHTDLRSFQTQDIYRQRTMQDLSLMTMDELDGLTMAEFSGMILVSQADPWTNSTIVDGGTTYQDFPILEIPITLGDDAIARSISDNLVDISSYQSTDYISIALPNFPLASVDTSQSFFEIEDYTGHGISLAFNASLTTLVAGNSELRFAMSNYTSLYLTGIRVVRFIIRPTASAVVRVMGIRAMKSNWSQLPTDFDTRIGAARRSIPKTGNVASLDVVSPAPLWRVADTGLMADTPQPVNSNIYTRFRSGKDYGTNKIEIYLRGLKKTFPDMSVMDTATMGDLDGQPQPDVGTPTTNTASYVRFSFSWTPSAGTGSYTIESTDGMTVTNSVTGITEDIDYILVTELNGTTARMHLHTFSSGILGSAVFDTGDIEDDGFAFKRRAGKFGYLLDLRSGSAHVDSIRPGRMVYREYRTLPFPSVTPVEGAQLFADYTPSTQLFQGFNATSAGITLTRDNGVNLSGSSFRVKDDGALPYQGIRSNSMYIADTGELELDLDIYSPISGSELSFYIEDEVGNLWPIAHRPVSQGQWDHYHLNLSTPTLVPSNYRLTILKAQPTPTPLTWWVDNVFVKDRAVSWFGRSESDLWDAPSPWIPFLGTVNNSNDGILFGERTKSIQVSGVARKPDATITRLQIKPKYAQLGRLVGTR